MIAIVVGLAGDAVVVDRGVGASPDRGVGVVAGDRLTMEHGSPRPHGLFRKPPDIKGESDDDTHAREINVLA